jgi:Mus7/MMS22 family
MSGRQRRNAVTIDTEDIAFRRALEPSVRRARQSPNWLLTSGLPRTRRPSRQALRGPINRTRSSSTLRVTSPPPDETRHRIVVDFDIPPLPRKVYTVSSCLGKGWLYELLSIASGTPPSHPLPPIEADGHRLLYPCVAELWICLVHLGTLRGRASGTPGDDFPPIVEILQDCPAAAESSTQGGVKASEDMVHLVWTVRPLPILCPWRIDIFCSHSTSWKLVLLALDHIRLVASPQVDNGLSSRNLRRRDAFIRLIVSQCLILHRRWSWRPVLDDDTSAVLFRRLVEIFKSRKFADLRGEIAGFAAFVQENDASLLVVPASTDSAFAIFLKLIYASAQQMKPSL